MEALQTVLPNNFGFQLDQWKLIAPYLWIICGVILIMLFAVAKKFNPKWFVFYLTSACLIGAAFSSYDLMATNKVLLFNQMLVVDQYASFFNFLISLIALFSVWGSFRYLDKENIQFPEFYLMILFSVFGMMLLTSSVDFLLLFIALEMMSLCIYTLVCFRRWDRKANEASLKYFIYGGGASAVFLYGVALLYGVTSSTKLEDIFNALTMYPKMPFIAVLGCWFILVGFLFKIAVVPFHAWLPDVYEGAPITVTGFMATALKAAAFGALIRAFHVVGWENIYPILWVLAALTMLIGNILAIVQKNIKRMLAYSSIAHTGYLAVGLVAALHSREVFDGILIYLVGYAAMTLGAFVILAILASRGDAHVELKDLSGVAQRHPGLAFAMAAFMFSMAGVPPTAGFVGKYLVFYSAVQAGEIVLVVLAVLMSVISVYYYLRVIVYMYMKEPESSPAHQRTSFWSGITVLAMLCLTFQIGFFPKQVLKIVQLAASQIYL